jgi:hypothetical protein
VVDDVPFDVVLIELVELINGLNNAGAVVVPKYPPTRKLEVVADVDE